MATRVTRQQVEYWFARLAEALGVSTVAWTFEDGKSVAHVGAWGLDYNPTYGGYVIYEIMNNGGGVREPFGPYRQRPAQFVQTCRFALDALDIARRKK